MQRSCSRQPRVSGPTMRNFRGSLCFALRWWGGFSIFKPVQVDLRSIDHVYKNQFGKHLDKLVKEETGGHYRSTLLGLIPQAHHGHHGRSRWDKDRQSPSWCDPSAANNFLKTFHIWQQGNTASRTYISYFGMHKSWNKFVLIHKNISASNPQQIQICHKNQSDLPQKPIKFATKTNQKEQFDDLGLILIIEFITFKFYHISPPFSC